MVGDALFCALKMQCAHSYLAMRTGLIASVQHLLPHKASGCFLRMHWFGTCCGVSSRATMDGGAGGADGCCSCKEHSAQVCKTNTQKGGQGMQIGLAAQHGATLQGCRSAARSPGVMAAERPGWLLQPLSAYIFTPLDS